jgi:hypothetical protein
MGAGSRDIAERALRWLGHVARMPSDKLPRRMLTAWVYQAKGSSARKSVAKQTTYGGTVARYHFKYVLMNPSIHPDVREALTKEVERRSIKTGKKISFATLKADKSYERYAGGVRQARRRKSTLTSGLSILDRLYFNSNHVRGVT